MKNARRIIYSIAVLILLTMLLTGCNCTKEVTLSVDGAQNVVEVPCGEKMEIPENPVKEGYVFAGWFTNSELTEKYDFEEPVKRDFTLYGKFILDVS